MHVAIVCRGMGGSGSVASVALRQARELAKRMEVTLVSDSFPAETPFAARALVSMPDLHVLRRFRHVPDELFFARGVRRALPSADFALCHSHAVAHLALRKANMPFGLVVHGDITDRPTGTYDPRLTAFYRWVAPRGYRAANVTIVLAPYFVELARKGGARSVEVMPNGIDLTDLGVATAASAVEENRFLYVGRLSVEKGIHVLLDAWPQVTANASLTILGSGPIAIPSLPNIHLATPQPRNTLATVYANHTALIAPSLSETFPLAILEALACGLPIIATNTGGIPSIVTHEHNGLLVPPNDSRALAAAIDRLANDAELRQRLASNARASVLPKYSWEAVGARLAEIIGERAAPPAVTRAAGPR
ncbi:MAG: glycosyltransferase family 4 protein [Thermoanaerobaculia bacterium]